MLSDNGTNFVGAIKEMENVEVSSYSGAEHENDSKLKWVFNPPYSPHFGGIFESMVKCAKRAMDAIIGRASLSDEDLDSVFVEIEGILNSRPLCAASKDIKGELELTSNHF